MTTPADAVPAPPAITFAVPYYSNRDYLIKAIGSVQAQSRSDWLLLVVDDAGPEPIDDLIAELGDDRISSHRNESNLGLANNWNRCIGLSGAPARARRARTTDSQMNQTPAAPARTG